MPRFSIPTLSVIGELGKVHGTKGELTAYFTIDALQILEPRHSFIFVEIDALVVPFRLNQIREKGQDAYLLCLETISSIDEAQKLVGCKLYLPTECLETEEVSFTWQHFVGFSLLDESLHTIGEIVEVNDLTENILFTVLSPEGKELLIPIHEDLVTHIEVAQKRLSVQLPQGLLDL